MNFKKIRVEEPSSSWPRRWSVFFEFDEPRSSVQMVHDTKDGVQGLLDSLDEAAAAIHTLTSPPKKKAAKKKGK